MKKKTYIKSETKKAKEKRIIDYCENNFHLQNIEISRNLGINRDTIAKYRKVTPSYLQDEIREYYDGTGVLSNNSNNKISDFFNEKWEQFYDKEKELYNLHLNTGDGVTINITVSEKKINALLPIRKINVFLPNTALHAFPVAVTNRCLYSPIPSSLLYRSMILLT